MKLLRWISLMALCGASSAQTASVQETPLAGLRSPTVLIPLTTITFDFERAIPAATKWGFEIRRDGSGRYYKKAAPATEHDAGNAWQDVHVSSKTLEVLESGADRREERCETRTKNIAQTGKKILTYWQGDLPFRCEFNYSDIPGVMKASDAFLAMGQTMQVGEELTRLRRFDRLGLDAELSFLESAARDGRALEIQNIAPVLKAIAEDDRVMERARRKAAHLLEDSSPAE